MSKRRREKGENMRHNGSETEKRETYRLDVRKADGVVMQGRESAKCCTDQGSFVFGFTFLNIASSVATS